VLFAGNTEFSHFDVDVDEFQPHDDEPEEERGQFRNLLFDAELSSQPNDVLHFMDVDGETVFIRASDIALIQIPLWVIYPDLLDVEELAEA
jgi:hypothetical protein